MLNHFIAFSTLQLLFHELINAVHFSLLCVSGVIVKAKGILRFVEAISEKTLRSTVAMTAARGRGKSAALGLAIAAAVGFG